jgi:hypothetical protein
MQASAVLCRSRNATPVTQSLYEKLIMESLESYKSDLSYSGWGFYIFVTYICAIVNYFSHLLLSSFVSIGCVIESRDTSLGIVTDYELDDRMIGVRFPTGAGNFFSSPPCPDRPRAYPAPYPLGTGALCLRVKQPRREVDHSHPSSAEVEWVELYLHSPNTSPWRGA